MNCINFQLIKLFYKMKSSILGSFFIVFMVLFFSSCNSKNNTNTANDSLTNSKLPDSVDFVFDIKPILSDRCFACHGPDKNAVEGGLSLSLAKDAYSLLGENKDHTAIVPGNSEKSTLVERIFAEDASIMPPKSSNLFLSEYEKALLKKWIEQGAKYKKHWAYVSPVLPEIPVTNNTEWGNNEIDKFILAKLEEKELSPSKIASDEKRLRRVNFAITGLPPSPEMIKKFKTNPGKEAYEVIIDSLFKTDHYAEHRTADWMDVARYADTNGYQDDFERTMWPWRDWVIHAFKENYSYKDFISYQVAGDLFPNPTKEQILATGFNRNHKITGEGGVIPEEYRVEYVEDRTNTFSTAFLGLTMECARCHDHKYDPISQKNHFELFSFFNNIPEQGLVTREEIPEPIVWVTEKEAQGVLDFINLNKSTSKKVPVMVMEEMKDKRASFILDRGVYDRPTEQVYPNTPDKILPFAKTYPKNRLGLAKWLFQKEHPLTARVAVNRLWQSMFGNGLVATSNDFGNQGALPTHPKLLDFLALKYIEMDWDTQKMLKYIALSATFQQSTVTSKEIQEIDPSNRWLSHAPRLRLSAEIIRDQALQISGLLHQEIGGPSVKPYQPFGIWEETTGGGGGKTGSYIQSTGEDLYRKSLYTYWKRTVPPPSMMTFDAASRDLCAVKRQETNTPLQALVLLNDPQIIEAAKVLAFNTLEQYPKAIDEQIESLFLKATSRLPNKTEKERLINFYNESLKKVHSKSIDAETYLAIGEYSLPTVSDVTALAALTMTAHTILNLDETISRG